jgi:hypothetical protein
MHPFFSPFENDDTGNYASVWSAHPGWLAIATQARDMAKWCGITEISPQTMERWLRLWALAYALDSLIDDHPPALRHEAGQIFEQVLTAPDTANNLPGWVDSNVVPLARLLKNAMSELGPSAWNDCAEAALKIRDIGKLKANERRLRPYLRLIKTEAEWTARLVFVCMNSEERRHVRYSNFACAFNHLATGGGFYDHARDLGEDYEEGLTLVKPNKLKAGLLLLRGVLEVAKFTLHPRVATKLYRIKLRPYPRLQIMAYWAETEHSMWMARAEALDL